MIYKLIGAGRFDEYKVIVLCFCFFAFNIMVNAQKSQRVFPNDVFGKGGKSEVYRGEKKDSIIIRDPKGTVRQRTVKLTERCNEIRDETSNYDSTGKLTSSSVRSVDSLGNVIYKESLYKDGVVVYSFSTEKDKNTGQVSGIAPETVDNLYKPRVEAVYRSGLEPTTTGTPRNWQMDPFGKGTLHIPLQNVMKLNCYDKELNGIKTSSKQSYGFMSDLEYNLTQGFGIRAGFDLDNAIEKFVNGNKTKTNEWEVSGGLRYGMNITNDLTLYGRLSGFYGKQETTQETPTTKTTDEVKTQGLKATIGSLFPLRKTENVYIGANAYYLNTINKYLDGREKQNEFGIHIAPELYIDGCNLFNKGNEQKGSQYQGNLLIEPFSKISANFGKSVVDYINPAFPNYEYNFSQAHVNLNGLYYITPLIGVGANTGYRYEKQESKANNFEYVQTRWSFFPQVAVNGPGKLNNAFIQLYGGVGGQKGETKIGSMTTTTKSSINRFGGGIGYNFPISPDAYLTPAFNYNMSTVKNKDTGAKQETDGFELELKYRIKLKF